MRLTVLRIASLLVIGILLPVLVFLNIFLGNTLSSFGFLIFIVGLVLTIIGTSIWVLFNILEYIKPFRSFGLYFVYGGLAFLILGVICSMIMPVIHSFGQPWVLPD